MRATPASWAARPPAATTEPSKTDRTRSTLRGIALLTTVWHHVLCGDLGQGGFGSFVGSFFSRRHAATRRAARRPAGFEHNRGGRGIGDRDVIVAVQLRHFAGQRTAHRHPIEKFNPLGPGQLDELRDRVADEFVGLARKLVEAELIELLVDESGARTVELMRQAADADDQ